VKTYEEFEHMRDMANVSNYRVAKELRLGVSFFYKWRVGAINPKDTTLGRIEAYLLSND
jgi:hypothetical protein